MFTGSIENSALVMSMGDTYIPSVWIFKPGYLQRGRLDACIWEKQGYNHDVKMKSGRVLWMGREGG